MSVPINYLAVLLAAVSTMPLGFLWYGPLFGKQWMKLTGMTEAKMKEAKREGKDTQGYVMMFVGSLAMAYVMAHALVFAMDYLEVSGVAAGLMTGFWNWFGFVAPVTMSSVLWDGKPMKLWFINNGYNLLMMCVMGVILAVMH